MVTAQTRDILKEAYTAHSNNIAAPLSVDAAAILDVHTQSTTKSHNNPQT